MTWLDALTEKSLARQLPTRAEALKVLQSGDDELVDVVFALRELDPGSVPVNFLIPFEGTTRPANA